MNPTGDIAHDKTKQICNELIKKNGQVGLTKYHYFISLIEQEYSVNYKNSAQKMQNLRIITYRVKDVFLKLFF